VEKTGIAKSKKLRSTLTTASGCLTRLREYLRLGREGRVIQRPKIVPMQRVGPPVGGVFGRLAESKPITKNLSYRTTGETNETIRRKTKKYV